MGVLDGIRVLDLAGVSGALAGKLLAGLGADVVKVEPPGGDPARRIPPFVDGVPHPERSLFFWFYHLGKRSLVLDWRREPARLDEATGELSDAHQVEREAVGALGQRALVLHQAREAPPHAPEATHDDPDPPARGAPSSRFEEEMPHLCHWSPLDRVGPGDASHGQHVRRWNSKPIWAR